MALLFQRIKAHSAGLLAIGGRNKCCGHGSRSHRNRQTCPQL